MRFKKAIAGILTAVMAVSGFGFSALPSHAATNIAIKIGDANGDDGVTALDALYITSYLKGTYEATAQQVTSMDVNQDGMVDSKDRTELLSRLASGDTFPTVSYIYEKPHDEITAYRRHTCSLTDTTSSTLYTLQRNALSSSSLVESEAISKKEESVSINSAFLDYENFSCVELIITNADNTVSHASGFIVGENVVATSAKALYKNGFAKNIKVNVYDAVCSFTMESEEAVTIHIPDAYIGSNGTPNVNYDYGLVYLGEYADLSEYAVNFGVMTNEFMKTANYNELTTSGFAYNSSAGKWVRYFNYGYVQTMTNANQKPYRFHSLGESKEGGMVYSGFTTPNKRVVGISNTTNTDTYGIRITPTLLRFYLQNNQLS